MGIVYGELSMSLDGFVADENGSVRGLFGWYGSGPVEVTPPGAHDAYHVSEASAEHLREGFERVGAIVAGRNTFDLTDGFGGAHPYGVPVFVVTHGTPDGYPKPDVPFAFVHDGVASAVGRAVAAADGKDVSVGAADVIQQALNQGVLDEIRVNLVPVLLGDGLPFFANLTTPVELGDPDASQGKGVLHLRFPVTRCKDPE